MGYYTGPIFEIQHGDATSSIAGGGRYDRMVGKFIGRDVPATGFSIGFERVIGILMERGASPEGDGLRVALVFDDTMDLAPVLGLARDLREQGRHVLLETRGKRLGKQLQDLEARGFRRIGVVGADGTVEWREPRTAGTEETKA
jgi:histidyl-tRNA synthetase